MILIRTIATLVCGLAVVLAGVPSAAAQVTLEQSMSMDEVGIETVKEGTDIVGVKVRDDWCPRGAICSKDAAAGTSGFVRFLLTMAGVLLKFAGIVAVIVIVIGGVRLVISHGNDEAVSSAHKHILWAVLGLLLIMLALVIVQNVTRVIYDTTGAADAATACSTTLDRVAGMADQAEAGRQLAETCTAEELAALDAEYYRTLACTMTDVDAAVSHGRQPGALLMSRVCTPISLTTLQSTLEK